jgi:alpha-beta hydrolase superfamily lysophospholipase
LKFLGLVVVLVVAACAPVSVAPSGVNRAPALEAGAIVADDGYRLALQSWLPTGHPNAVILALHGMNDYANAFAMPGPWWAERGIAVYAYDQRGFGRNSDAGLWHGAEPIVDDLADVVAVLLARHQGMPFYVLGESMGGAVLLALLARPNAPPIDGAILAAPAVWGRASMNPINRALLWIMSTLFPGGWVDGRGITVQASDDIEMLRALGRDPLVVKRTRSDSIRGLVDLMDLAYAAPATLPPVPTLMLYGEKDQIIPKGPVEEFIAAMKGRMRIAIYPDGWHLLLRDFQREVVWRDIVAWTAAPKAPLPSGTEWDGERPLFPRRF